MKTNKFISPFISCVVQNFPFIEESIDGLTQYELLCKIVEKLNAVITQTNTQTENIEKLEVAFTTLKNYVDNYFNNLDIQTEINNKLDEMATSGELEALIASYLNTQAVRGFSTLNDLKNATGLITGAICQTSGKNTYKDGLGSLYRIRNITNEDVVDNDKLVAITSDVSLVAEKITNNIRNTKATSDTETYSCNYINNVLNNKNCLSVKRDEDTLVVTAWQTYDVNFSTINAQKGTDLSLNSSGQIVIGENINYIKVSLNFEFISDTTSTSYIQFKISKNSNVIAVNRIYNLTQDVRENAYITPILIPVEKNDIISLQITPAFDATLTLGGGNYSFMTVEEI